jgi:hypothetical protein
MDFRLPVGTGRVDPMHERVLLACTPSARIHAVTDTTTGWTCYEVTRAASQRVETLAQAEQLASDLADAVLLGPGDVVLLGRATPDGEEPYRFGFGYVETTDVRFDGAPEVGPGLRLLGDFGEGETGDLDECWDAFASYTGDRRAEDRDRMRAAARSGENPVGEPCDEWRWVCGIDQRDLVWRTGPVVLRWQYRPSSPGDSWLQDRRVVLVADCRTEVEARGRFGACVAALERRAHGYLLGDEEIGALGTERVD